MTKKLTVEISEGLGNQMFMYAHAFALSKKLNYDLVVDNKSGYSKDKNLLRKHQNFLLDNFNLLGRLANNNEIYDTSFKRFMKKIFILYDFFNVKKNFLLEKKIKNKSKKYVNPLIDIDANSLSNNLYIQGNFENEDYFKDFRSQLLNIFTIQKEKIHISNTIIEKLNNTNSVSIHIRRNRFSDQSKIINDYNIKRSIQFENDSLNYINKSIQLMNSKLDKPEYFIWTNDLDNIDNTLKNINLKNYILINNDTINDFYLFSYSKHFIVSPSSFHWWGAWLNQNNDKICLRPSKINPSNNPNFWPNNWISV